MPLDRQSSVNVQVGAAHLPGPGAVLAGPGVPRLTAAMLVIRVIGELDVRLAGATAELPASRRARALLSWLAVHPGRHSRSRLAGQFWPEVLDPSARASLRSALWSLRSALGPGFAGYLATERDSIALAGAGLQVDLLEVRRLLAAGSPEAALDPGRGGDVGTPPRGALPAGRARRGRPDQRACRGR